MTKEQTNKINEALKGIPVLGGFRNKFNNLFIELYNKIDELTNKNAELEKKVNSLSTSLKEYKNAINTVILNQK